MPGVSSADREQVLQVLGGPFREVPQGSWPRGRFMTSGAHFLTEGAWFSRHDVLGLPPVPGGQCTP